MVEEIVVITGGSSGIGKALAARFLKDGSTVIIGARRLTVIEQAINELKEKRVNKTQSIEGLSLDVSDTESVSTFVSTVIEKYTKIDILINCAGISVCKEIENTSPDEFKNTMGINYLGTVFISNGFLPFMRDKNSGHIINISSMAGIMGVYGYSAYTPSKYAIIGYTEVLRSELVRTKISVSLVLPPDTETPQLIEENLTKPGITRKISGSIKPMDADVVAEAIFKSIRRKKYLIIPGPESKLVYLINRLFPGYIYSYSRKIINNDKNFNN